MSELIRFHLDENANNSITDGLRRYRIDVTRGLFGFSGFLYEKQIKFLRR